MSVWEAPKIKRPIPALPSCQFHVLCVIGMVHPMVIEADGRQSIVAPVQVFLNRPIEDLLPEMIQVSSSHPPNELRSQADPGPLVRRTGP